MIRTAIIAAMPGELKPLVHGWRHEKRNRLSGSNVDLWRWRFDAGEWIAASAGAGQNAATRALAEVEKDGPVASVLSVGWAGALSEAYLCGHAYHVSGVIDTLTGERFKASPFLPLRPKEDARAGHPDLWLATSPKVADANEKQRLATAYRAGLVDMEAAAIARLAAMRGVAFHCIKGVSDGFGDQLPDFNRFLTREGQFQTLRFTVFALFHPGYWPALKQMGENSKKAAQSMAEAILELLDPQETIRKRNGYPDHRR
ncbi:MAG TPA: nucleoside phosphorylase [Terracidiphilus sp.]|nr:nucleoside phosphorylase [Terracidiphilus sp.]